MNREKDSCGPEACLLAVQTNNIINLSYVRSGCMLWRKEKGEQDKDWDMGHVAELILAPLRR